MSSSEAPSQSRARGLGEAPAPLQVSAWPWKTAREAGPQRRELGWGLPLPPPLQGAPQASTEVGKARGPSDPHRYLPPGPSHLPSLYPAPPSEGISICSSLSCCLTRDPRHAGGTLVCAVGKESTRNACLIPRLGRSAGEGIGYPLQYSWASLVTEQVKNLPAMRKTWV